MKLFLGSVAWRNEEEGFAQSMRLLQRELDRRGIEFYEGFSVGDALVSRSRSLVASAFLRSDADVLLTIDTDIWFRAQDAISLAEKALAYDIIGGLYMTRALKTQPALLLPEGTTVMAEGQEPVEAQFLSTGFMATHRSVFETLTSGLPLCHQNWEDRGVNTSFWPFYMPFTIPWEGDGHMYLSEDWAFCHRAKEAGFKVWLDPTIRLGHIGSVMYTLEDLVRPPKPGPTPMALTRHGDELDTRMLERAKSNG